MEKKGITGNRYRIFPLFSLLSWENCEYVTNALCTAVNNRSEQGQTPQRGLKRLSLSAKREKN